MARAERAAMQTAVIGMAIALLGSASARAAGFEFLGLRSSMSPEEVQAAAPKGFELRMFPSTSSGALVRGYDFYAQLAFCNGRLVAVSRSLDADTSWAPAVEAAIRSRGQPRVFVESQPWTGPGGGNVSSVVLQWLDGQTRYSLSISPEGRDGKGDLRHNRAASEGYYQISGNSCWKPS